MTSAVRITNLGKRYRVNHSQERARYRTLRDSLVSAVKAPLRRLRGGMQGVSEDFWALKDISFEIQPGEVVGIIGRNGAGKSTLLKILSRITKPTTGEVEINGRVGSLLEVGTGFHPELTGRENIYLNGSILGMSRRAIARRFDEIIDFAEIEQFLDTPVKRYSSGMYVRLAFAVAAHLEPEFLLVDEVLAVGDHDFQQKCIGKMGDIAKSGRTILFVSHNLAALERLCTRAILVRSGRLARFGDVQPTVAEYLSDALQSESGAFDVNNHPARRQAHAPIITRLVVRSARYEPTTTIEVGTPMIVELELNCTTAIRRPRLAIAIEDAYGRRITTAATYFSDSDLPDLYGKCSVRCEIPDVNLSHGKYLLSASVATKEEGLLDSLDNVAWFTIIWRDYFANGEPHGPQFGPVLSKSRWDGPFRDTKTDSVL